MVYEMNKSFVTKVLLVSTVLMAGILLIPTNIHDAKANPCSNVGADATGGNGAIGGSSGPAGTGGNGGSAGIDAFGGNGGNTGSAGDGSEGSPGTSFVTPKCNFGEAVLNEP